MDKIVYGSSSIFITLVIVTVSALVLDFYPISVSSHKIEYRQYELKITEFPQFPPPEPHTKQIVNWNHTWPNGEIIYKITHDFNSTERDLIQGAMDEISNKTCVKFKRKRKGDKDFVYITKVLGDGCYSSTGVHGGQQTLNLDPRKCIQHGKIVHELLHSTGFHHEHQRPDRDLYIDILWDNIKPGDFNQFKILNAPPEYLEGFPYDCESVLHYGPISFFLAKDIDEPILNAKGYEPNLGQRIGMSTLDVIKVNLLYNCSK